jgi:hypothetical protein
MREDGRAPFYTWRCFLFFPVDRGCPQETGLVREDFLLKARM